jgi:hypothetical protein
MPKSKQRKPSDKGETMTPSRVLDVIDNCLKDMSRTWPAKELSSEEIEHWHQDLGPFPVKAIEWAFDNWRRNGRFFPVYGDILDQCVAWEPPEHTRKPICDAQCKADHGKGYHWNDVYWLLVKLKAPCAVGAEFARKEPVKPGEIEALMEELDRKRPGGAPEWRRQRVIAWAGRSFGRRPETSARHSP